jgi:hypothetical protein
LTRQTCNPGWDRQLWQITEQNIATPWLNVLFATIQCTLLSKERSAKAIPLTNPKLSYLAWVAGLPSQPQSNIILVFYNETTLFRTKK